MKSRYSIEEVIAGTINFVFSIAMVGLIIRFVFKLLGANPQADVVRFIYNSTSPLLAPFRRIFAPEVIEPGAIIEFSTLIAIVFYLIIAWLLVELIGLFAAYAKSNK